MWRRAALRGALAPEVCGARYAELGGRSAAGRVACHPQNGAYPA